MGAGRHSIVKISKASLRMEIIRFSIDENTGAKIPHRKIIENPNFMENTGLFSMKLGYRSPVSLGTYTKHCQDLGLTNEVIFLEGKRLGLIPTFTLFDDWDTTLYKRMTTGLVSDAISRKEFDVWTRVKNYAGLEYINLEVTSIEDLKSSLKVMGYSENNISEMYSMSKEGKL